MRRWLILLLIMSLAPFAGFLGGLETVKLKKTGIGSVPDAVIPGLGSVCLDPSGNLFALSGKSSHEECFVVSWDAALRFKRRFGRSGRGPGEFSMFSSPLSDRRSVDAEGHVCVLDYNPRRLVIFSNNGDYERDIMTDRDYIASLGRLNAIKAVHKNVFIAFQHNREPPDRGVIFTFHPPVVRAAFTYHNEKIRAEGNDFTSDYYRDNCLLDACGGVIVFADSRRYRAAAYNAGGKRLFVTGGMDALPPPFSEREPEALIQRELTPDNASSDYMKQFLTELRAKKDVYRQLLKKIQHSRNALRLVKTAGERVYLFATPSDAAKPAGYPTHLYDKTGKKLKSVLFPGLPAAIAGRMLITVSGMKRTTP